MPMTRRGFTVVEVMVGVTVLATVLLFIAGLQIIQSRLTWRAVLQQRANAVLLQRVESYEGRSWNSLAAPGTGTCLFDTTAAKNSLRFFRCDTVSAPTGSTTERDIDIYVIAPINQLSGFIPTLPSPATDSAIRRDFIRLRARVQRFQPSPDPL